MLCRLFVAHFVVLSGVQLLSVTVNRETCCQCRCLLLGLESVGALTQHHGQSSGVPLRMLPFLFCGLYRGNSIAAEFLTPDRFGFVIFRYCCVLRSIVFVNLLVSVFVSIIQCLHPFYTSPSYNARHIYASEMLVELGMHSRRQGTLAGQGGAAAHAVLTGQLTGRDGRKQKV